MKKGGKIVYLNNSGEEVPGSDPSAVKRFDTNKYQELPLGGRHRKTRRGRSRARGKKKRHTTRKH